MKIKLMKYFLRRINGISLCGGVVIAMKIKPGENFTAEKFYSQKITELRYSFLFLATHKLANTLMTVYKLAKVKIHVYLYHTCPHFKGTASGNKTPIPSVNSCYKR